MWKYPLVGLTVAYDRRQRRRTARPQDGRSPNLGATCPGTTHRPVVTAGNAVDRSPHRGIAPEPPGAACSLDVVHLRTNRPTCRQSTLNVLSPVTDHQPSPATPSTTGRAARPSAEIVWLAAVFVAFVFVYAPTFAWLVERWTMSVWHNLHGMFIAPVVAYLVWTELRETRALGRSASPLGFLFLGPALCLLALDAGMHTQLLSAVSFVFALPGIFLLLLV